MSLEKPWEEGGDHSGKSQRNAGAAAGVYLLLEVADGVLVSVGEEVQDVVFDVVLLQVVHQVGPVALEFQTFRCSKH